MSKYRKTQQAAGNWVVEVYCNSVWEIAWYCKDEASADKALERSIKKDNEWAAMTEEQRRKAILR